MTPLGGQRSATTLPCCDSTAILLIDVSRTHIRVHYLSNKEMKSEHQNKELMQRAVRHLLVTDDDVMNEAERIVGHTLQRENQGDNGCLTVTEIARELDMEARDLNSFLRDKGIQKWKQGQYRLTPPYEGRGLTHDRLFIYYSKDGKKKHQTYLVWTPKGLEFIRKLIKGKGL